MDVNELIWAAGYLSGRGSITKGQTTPRMTVISSHDYEGLERFANAVGLVVTRTSVPMRRTVTASGDKLREVMMALWPYLTEARKENYLVARRQWLISRGLATSKVIRKEGDRQ